MISTVTKKQFQSAIIKFVLSVTLGEVVSPGWTLSAWVVTKGKKPLQATVCFSIEHAHPHDVYVTKSNDISSLLFGKKVWEF